MRWMWLAFCAVLALAAGISTGAAATDSVVMFRLASDYRVSLDPYRLVGSDAAINDVLGLLMNV